jgi:hypothetical protein
MTDTEPTTTDELEAELEAEPYLRAYVEIGDVSVEAARRRFRADQTLARRELRRAGVGVAIRYTRRGMLTTCNDKSEVLFAEQDDER